jgi:hypothetical protein
MLSQTLVIRASHNLARANRAGEITIRESLDLLDGPFAELADGVAEDLYARWRWLSSITFNIVLRPETRAEVASVNQNAEVEPARSL